MDQNNSYTELEKSVELLMNAFNNILYMTPDELVITPTRNNLNEIAGCLDKIFPENKCVDILYTQNYDKLYFGIRVNPVIDSSTIIGIIGSDDRIKLGKYKIEFDSKLFNMGLSPQELTAYTLYEISSMCTSYQIIDELRAVIDLNMTSNDDTIYLKDSAHYAQLIIYAVKDALVKLSSLVYKDDASEYVSNTLIQATDLDEYLVSAHDSIIASESGPKDSLRSSNTSILQWMFLMYRDMRVNSSTIMDALKDAKTTTGSKLDIEEINKTIDSVNRIDSTISPKIESLELPKFFEAMNMSSVNEFSIFSGLKRNGLRSIEDYLYEASMRIKNLETEEDAVFVMRSISTRMNILADYIYNTPGISDREREYWENVYYKYSKLREDLVKKKIWNKKQYGLFFDYNQDFGDKPFGEAVQSAAILNDYIESKIAERAEEGEGYTLEDVSNWVAEKGAKVIDFKSYPDGRVEGVFEFVQLKKSNGVIEFLKNKFNSADFKTLNSNNINKSIEGEKHSGLEKEWAKVIRSQISNKNPKIANKKYLDLIKKLEKLNLVLIWKKSGTQLGYDLKTNKIYCFDKTEGLINGTTNVNKVLTLNSVNETTNWDNVVKPKPVFEYTDEQLEADLEKISFNENGEVVITEDEDPNSNTITSNDKPENTTSSTNSNDNKEQEIKIDGSKNGETESKSNLSITATSDNPVYNVKVQESDQQVDPNIESKKETKKEVEDKVPDSVDITIPDDINESILFGSDSKANSNYMNEIFKENGSACCECGSTNVTIGEDGNCTCNECGKTFIISKEDDKDFFNESLIDGVLDEDFKWLDDLSEYIKESAEFDEGVVVEGSFKEFLERINKWKEEWKTSNFKNKKSNFHSSSLTDQEYDEVKGYLDILTKPNVKYSEYHKAFAALCKFCYISPRGTIITRHELKRGNSDNNHSLELDYISNIKKIKLPEGLKLFHLSKIPGITKLVPQFKGKSGKGYLYDRPRIYFIIDKFLPKLKSNPTNSMHRYEVKTNITDVYVDPLVWKTSQGAVYVETDKEIPVEEIKFGDKLKSKFIGKDQEDVGTEDNNESNDDNLF